MNTLIDRLRSVDDGLSAGKDHVTCYSCVDSKEIANQAAWEIERLNAEVTRHLVAHGNRTNELDRLTEEIRQLNIANDCRDYDDVYGEDR